jgi:hypothetical protein
VRGLDLFLGLLLASAAAGFTLHRASLMHPVLYQYHAAGIETTDIWFDGDLPRQSCVMTDRLAWQHHETSEHPLVSFAAYVPGQVVHAIAGGGWIRSFRLTAALYGAAWTAFFFALLRLMGLARLDAAVFTMLGGVSAAAVFWMPVPESFVAGSLTMLSPIALVAAGTAGTWRMTMASAASFSMTVTNWMTGLLAAFSSRPWRQALQISANALLLVTALWVVQSLWFPENLFFLGSRQGFDMLVDDERPAVVGSLASFWSHAIVMPEIAIKTDEAWRGLTVQRAWPGSSGWLGMTSVGLWAGLLVMGASALVRLTVTAPIRPLLLAAIAGQCVLHVAIGRETFLYSMHFAPLLIAMAACAALGRTRTAALAIAVLLIVTAGANNWQQFARATTIVNDIANDAASRGAVFQPADRCR